MSLHTLENWIEFGSAILALVLFLIKIRGMRPYLPVGLFAHVYADYICVAAMKFFHWWSFPDRIYPGISISISANKIAIPILAMFWVRYLPDRLTMRILWWFSWSISLAVGEYFANRYTRLIEYGNGYDWYWTLVFWLITWPIWYTFHLWMHGQLTWENFLGKRS